MPLQALGQVQDCNRLVFHDQKVVTVHLIFAYGTPNFICCWEERACMVLLAATCIMLSWLLVTLS